MKSIFLSILGLGCLALGFGSSSAFSQEFGLSLGVHQSEVTSTNTNVTTDGVFGFRLGGVVGVPLSEHIKFRSGLLYTQRHFEVKLTGEKATARFDYMDVPALLQFQFNENFGVFGGMIVAFNVNHDLNLNSSTPGVARTATGTKDMLPLFQIGVSGTFQDEFGIEAYFERGVGDIYDNAKDYSVFGANFIYWL